MMRVLSVFLLSLVIISCSSEQVKPVYIGQSEFIFMRPENIAHLEHLEPLAVPYSLNYQTQKWLKEKQELSFEETMDKESRTFYLGNIALNIHPIVSIMRNQKYCRIIQESLRLGVDEWVSQYLACKLPNGNWGQFNVPDVY